MVTRTRGDARLWVRQGTKLFAEALAGLDETGYAAASPLPGWTRKHLVAHVAANADAVGNLVHWAATGERTPMYSSPEQRSTDIEAGATRPGGELARWFTRSAEKLESAFDRLTDQQWNHEVVTAQGRSVPASETPWMRAREVLVHAVDLETGVGFGDLPGGFLTALGQDIAGKRSAAAGTPAGGPALVVEPTDADVRWSVAGYAGPVVVTGSLAALTAYLAGRGSTGVTSPDHPVPPLPAWL